MSKAEAEVCIGPGIASTIREAPQHEGAVHGREA
jgi:hypothetical protein